LLAEIFFILQVPLFVIHIDSQHNFNQGINSLSKLWWRLLNYVLAPAPQDLITLDSIGSTQFCVSNNRGVGTYSSIGTYAFVGTYTLKGAFTRKGTYETEGTFLTHAKTLVAETGYALQRVT
jgi:hypothetical protein